MKPVYPGILFLSRVQKSWIYNDNLINFYYLKDLFEIKNLLVIMFMFMNDIFFFLCRNSKLYTGDLLSL